MIPIFNLIEMRYGRSVRIDIDDSLREEQKFLPPASLQLLVENAIKHNGHSSDAPLQIDILRTDDRIEVRNTLSPLLSTIASTGLGLKNIRERYALLGSEKVVVRKDASFYSVSLPLLNRND